jgi:hypothetical protein
MSLLPWTTLHSDSEQQLSYEYQAATKVLRIKYQAAPNCPKNIRLQPLSSELNIRLLPIVLRISGCNQGPLNLISGCSQLSYEYQAVTKVL